MAGAQHADPGRPSRTVWTLRQWRCELTDEGILRLLHSSRVISERAVRSKSDAEHWADIWLETLERPLERVPRADDGGV